MIEKLQTKDEKAAHSLMAELGYDVTEDQFYKNIKHLRHQKSEILVAKSGGDVVGLIAARISVGIVEGNYGEIIALVVSAQHRRKGIGKDLVSKAEEWLFSETDIVRVRSNVLRGEAHEFYTSLDYSNVKTQKLYKKSYSKQGQPTR